MCEIPTSTAATTDYSYSMNRFTSSCNTSFLTTLFSPGTTGGDAAAATSQRLLDGNAMNYTSRSASNVAGGTIVVSVPPSSEVAPLSASRGSLSAWSSASESSYDTQAELRTEDLVLGEISSTMDATAIMEGRQRAERVVKDFVVGFCGG